MLQTPWRQQKDAPDDLPGLMKFREKYKIVLLQKKQNHIFMTKKIYIL